MKKKIKGGLTFMAGILIGYCLIQGLSFLQQNYLWAVFYK